MTILTHSQLVNEANQLINEVDQIADLTDDQPTSTPCGQLTEEQLAGLNSASLKTLAKELRVKNWWKLPMSALRIEILAIYSQSAPNFEVVASSLSLEAYLNPEANQSQPEAPEANQGQTEAPEAPETDQSQPEALEANQGQPEAPEAQEANQSQPETDRKLPETLEDFRQLIKDNLEVTEEEMESLLSGWSITNPKCKTPNVAVVKRVTLFKFINNRIKSMVSLDEYLDYELDDPTFNQVITLASRYLARAPLTIKGASRFKYLLPNAAVSVVIWTLDNIDKIQVAIELADKAANQGYSSPKTTRESRGLEPKANRLSQ